MTSHLPSRPHSARDTFPVTGTGEVGHREHTQIVIPLRERIAPDEKSIDPAIPKIIAEAEYLYFLGYGFDPRNNTLLGLGQPPSGSHRQHVYFTNYCNHNKISKSVERAFHLINSDAVSGSPYGDLLGDHYVKITNTTLGDLQYRVEKSIKSVYDALAQDFDWPPDAQKPPHPEPVEG
ncbi:MAG: hypothetical protein WCD42_13700 [Rhizomicrobium sp.]